MEETPVISQSAPAKQSTPPPPSAAEATPDAAVATPLQPDIHMTDAAPPSDVQRPDDTMSGEPESGEEIVDIVGSVEGTSMEIDVKPEPAPADASTTIQSQLVNSPALTSRKLDPASPSIVITPTDTKIPLPTRTPSPPKKRKFTPESSPDQPLNQNPSDNSAQSTQPEVQGQIAVEKLQLPSKSVKKSKKQPPKRPQNTKKKNTNAPKRPVARKTKEKSASVGFDEVYSPSARLIAGHTNHIDSSI
jgi:hypothetical protein